MRNLLVLLSLLLTCNGFAQISFSGAQEAANKLNDGLLIVRLYTSSNEIEFLRENGRTEDAENLQSELDRENQAIRDAFANEYTFGEVAFMDAENSEKLVKGEWEGILQDGKGNVLNMDSIAFLVADISNTKRRGLAGLNVWDWKDGEWVHPPTPFPSHVSQYGFLGLAKRTFSEMVSKFNANFLNATRENLLVLKEGILVVRLASNTDQIGRLKAEGRTEEALELEQKTREKNESIRRAFVDFYTYGRVFFIDSEHSASLIEGDWSGIFTDGKGERVNVSVQPYMVADFSQLKDRDLSGLNIVKWNDHSEQWIHPESPFPYFVSEYTSISRSSRTPDMMVNIFNNELIELE